MAKRPEHKITAAAKKSYGHLSDFANFLFIREYVGSFLSALASATVLWIRATPPMVILGAFVVVFASFGYVLAHSWKRNPLTNGLASFVAIAVIGIIVLRYPS